MPSARSLPERAQKPSLMLAFVCALVVSAYDRRWLSGTVKSFVPEGGPSLERLSRLKARLAPDFEELVRKASRRGRPPRENASEDESLLLREVLALVPRRTWRYMPRPERRRLVEAQRRLKEEHGLTEKRFCELLGISGRTFRSWKKPRPERPAPEATPTADTEEEQPKKKRKPVATGRFDLEVVLPGQQVAADTSRWTLFGVPLQVVATQDPGSRREKLWESFTVDVRENSEIIAGVLEKALSEKPGTQVVTDQGTPYMSAETARAIEELQCEHAPQKEGTPTDKATLERSFRTVKDALEPLSELTKVIADRLPALRHGAFARAVGRVLLGVFLRVYAAAPREGGHPLEGRDRRELEIIAQEQRERARAENRSKRLLLGEIHAAYDFPGGVERFIRAHRHHALEDIQEAERRLRRNACRCKVRACDLYFAGILRNVRDENEKARQRERHAELRRLRQQREFAYEQRERQERDQVVRDHPEGVLAEALDLIAAQWLPGENALLARGRGPGRAQCHAALDSMRRHDPHAVRDRAEAVWRDWASESARDPAHLAAVRRVFDHVLEQFLAPVPSTEDLIGRTIGYRPTQRNRPPIRGPDLRNYEAGTWG
jgi:transposase InsO family protein